MKPWVIQSLLTCDSMDRTLKYDQAGVVFYFNFTHFAILESLFILDLALSRVKGLVGQLL